MEDIGLATGDRMRLYLFDVPEGLSMRILAIAIIAPESLFEGAVEAELKPRVAASAIKQIPSDPYVELKRAIASGTAIETPMFNLANQGVGLATSGAHLEPHLGTLADLRNEIIDDRSIQEHGHPTLGLKPVGDPEPLGKTLKPSSLSNLTPRQRNAKRIRKTLKPSSLSGVCP